MESPHDDPLDHSSPKQEMTCYPPRSTILQNLITLCQLTPGISVTKISANRDNNILPNLAVDIHPTDKIFLTVRVSLL